MIFLQPTWSTSQVLCHFKTHLLILLLSLWVELLEKVKRRQSKQRINPPLLPTSAYNMQLEQHNLICLPFCSQYLTCLTRKRNFNIWCIKCKIRWRYYRFHEIPLFYSQALPQGNTVVKEAQISQLFRASNSLRMTPSIPATSTRQISRKQNKFWIGLRSTSIYKNRN